MISIHTTLARLPLAVKRLALPILILAVLAAPAAAQDFVVTASDGSAQTDLSLNQNGTGTATIEGVTANITWSTNNGNIWIYLQDDLLATLEDAADPQQQQGDALNPQGNKFGVWDRMGT